MIKIFLTTKRSISLFIAILLLFLFQINFSLISYADCGTPAQDGVVSLSGIINTYYPGSSSVSAGNTSISIGAATGKGDAISSGNLLLVIQMQDGAINTSNSSNYGSNTGTGNGSTSIGSAGLYEYVVATNSVTTAGGTLNIRGTGSGNGLLNSYNKASYTAGSNGQKTFQVIKVPQYSIATMNSSLTARAWDGSTGGILAFDSVSALNLNTATVNLTGLGFRGGGAKQLGGDTGGNSTDYVTRASKAFNGSKGEGIAGTPRYVYDGSSVIDTGVEGYPSGSFGKGAPANAGGGGTDQKPGSNDENSGGGGGSNAGYGGIGGYNWSPSNSYSSEPNPFTTAVANAVGIYDVGGRGGSAFPSTVLRMILGGGGGAGSRNNSNGTIVSSGGVGGGMAFIRVGSIYGTGTINANGTTPPSPENDGAGGGGAGGSILFFAKTGTLNGLTLNTKGANGADAWPTGGSSFSNAHGPGGGGGGGFIAVSSLGANMSVAQGNNGITTVSLYNYNAQKPSIGGINITPFGEGTMPGTTSSTTCGSPSLTVTKTTSTPNVVAGNTATYTINVTNASGVGTATNLVISDTLPTGFTYSSSNTPILSGGATRTSTSNPANDATVPAWGNFSIPAGGGVSITFTVNVGTSVLTGTYQNPATATCDDPSVATGQVLKIKSSYDSASSTGEDVSVLNYKFSFTSNNLKSVTPGATITYPHKIISGTAGNVVLTITNTQGWPFTVFEDVNGNNILDTGDLAITNLSTLGNVFSKVNNEMNLLIRIQVPLNVGTNVTDVMTLSATLTPSASALAPITLINLDQTTVTDQVTGELQLIKTAKTYKDDGSPYDATGRTAKPNYFIDYFIDYKNISNGTLNNIKITDFVPAYTTLISSGFTAPATGTITNTPSTGITKTITWNVNGTLPQTQGGQVTFRVKLN